VFSKLLYSVCQYFSRRYGHWKFQLMLLICLTLNSKVAAVTVRNLSGLNQLLVQATFFYILVDNSSCCCGKSNKQFNSKLYIVSRRWGIRYILVNCNYLFVNTENIGGSLCKRIGVKLMWHVCMLRESSLYVKRIQIIFIEFYLYS
jgi:hypothetical protein